MAAFLLRLTRWLDRFYTLCGYLAAAFLISILVVIVLNMMARWTAYTFPGSTNYAGYFMAAASFLSLAYGLGKGAHIRVGLLLNALGRFRWYGELWALGLASIIACYFAYYAVGVTYGSYTWHDISQGQDATPLWIPQLAMAFGASVLALALVDNFLRALLSGHSWIGKDSVDQAHGE